MQKIKRLLKNGFGLLLTAAAILVLIGEIILIVGGPRPSTEYEPMAQQGQAKATNEGYPAPPTAIPPEPVPTEIIMPEPTQTSEEFPEIPPTEAGKAAVLYKGDIWLVEAGVEPQPLTGFGDVSIIFGWNRDSKYMIFGRGITPRPDLVASTDLWLLDIQTSQSNQLTFDQNTISAAWSPADNQIAYCDKNDNLIVVSIDGKILNQRGMVSCAFTWSPDGSSIAIETYTPDMILPDGLKYSVIAAWNVYNNSLKVFSQSKDEAQFWPLWSIDSQSIIFQRVSYDPLKQENPCWWTIVNIENSEIKCLENSPNSAEEISRSPKADIVAFRVNTSIYVMDFQGNFSVVGEGKSIEWLLDGKTLIYKNNDGKLQTVNIEISTKDTVIGGERFSSNLSSNPLYYFSIRN